MKDCEFCQNFIWTKKKLGTKIFDSPICNIKKCEVESPDWANKCKDYNIKDIK